MNADILLLLFYIYTVLFTRRSLCSKQIVHNCKPSLVDNIFINTLGNIYSGNILENISYDLPNFIILESEPLKQNKKTIIVRDMKTLIKKLSQKSYMIYNYVNK